MTDHQAILLAEYDALKRESLDRIKARDAFMYTTFAAVVAVLVAVLQTRSTAVLLLLSPACGILGWTRLRNDVHIVEIRWHIRDKIAPLLAEGVHGAVLTWETAQRRRSHKLVQLAVDVALFVGPGIGGVVGWAAQPGAFTNIGAAACGGADVLIAAAMTLAIVVYANPRDPRRRPGSTPGRTAATAAAPPAPLRRTRRTGGAQARSVARRTRAWKATTGSDRAAHRRHERDSTARF